MDKRKAFNFFRSYWEVGKELKEKDRIKFYDAILLYQFTGVVTELKGQARLMFISQKHNLDSQVAGYQSRMSIPSATPLGSPLTTPSATPLGTSISESESEIKKDNIKPIIEFPFKEIEFKVLWHEWKMFRLEKQNPLTPSSERKALQVLFEESGGNVDLAIKAINKSIASGHLSINPKPEPTFKPKEEPKKTKRVYE